MNAHKKRKTGEGSATEVEVAVAVAPVASTSALTTSSKSNGNSSNNGSAAVTVSKHKPRPARKQIELSELEAIKAAAEKSGQTGSIYNTWHNKWAGGDSYDAANNQRKSATRCEIARDSGYTRGDINGGAYVCLFFARGYCPNGSECNFLHRLPPPIALPEQGRDIFGREKHGDYRDDMGGVGSMQRVNRTLYIGRIHEEPRIGSHSSMQSDPNKAKKGSLMKRKFEELSPTEKVLWRHFSEWGEIERIRVLHFRGCGFVTYKSETSAQFAKEAMMNQSLDHDEVLNLRWATEDPNPGAKKENLRNLVKQGTEAIAASMTEDQREAGEAIRQLERESGIREDHLIGAPVDGELTAEDENGDEEAQQRRQQQLDAEEEELRRLEEENAKGWQEFEAQQQEPAAEPEAPTETQPQPPASKGLLSSDLLQGLTQLKTMQRKQPAASVLGSLAAYGSDSEDD